VNDSQEEHIAAQALKALHQEAPAPEAAQTPGETSELTGETGSSESRQMASQPPPELIGALPEQEPAAIDTGTPADEPSTPQAEPSTPEAEPILPPPVIVTTEAVAERFLAMNCPRCTASLSIYDRSTELQCGDCGAEVIVERKDCTVALRLRAEELVEEPDPIAVSAASAKRDEELQKLRAEAAVAMNVKRGVGILGGLCGVGFGYMGTTEMAAQHIGTGAGILICGGALLVSVVCITRHTTKVRADLTVRIRAITTSEEYSAGHP
jgi:predicted RNA-binding Zn-ribbon protein involved in translation (DUF1610 family)